ncbi:MAG: ABC transporter permease, partial [Blautia sp.]|nr:ABC transporter permease [Blautia sp.]
TAYGDADLPGNGPAISYPLIRLMNALSDGMMILVILLASVVILAISILCIRYILLTSLEKDKREIGMLKAIGISRKDIRGLYFSKFLLLSILGMILGGASSALIWVFLGRQMTDLYGPVDHMGRILIISLLGILLVEGMILLSVRRTLKVTEKLSAVEALYGLGRFERKKNRYLFLAFVTAAATALVLIPQNIATTLSSPGFVNYMGIGESQIRIDVRQGVDMEAISQDLYQEIEEDSRTGGAVLMETRSFRIATEDGREYRILIEEGDHGRYPVKYSEGSWPTAKDEIALSKLLSEELGVKLGDTLTIWAGGEEKIPCRVCGIYGDVTNGGKTAKASFDVPSGDIPLMWGILYLNLKDGNSVTEWTQEFQAKVENLPAQIRVTEISQYVLSMYGPTIKLIERAAWVSMGASLAVLSIVVLLFMRLIVWQERGDCSLKKALGFVSADIRVTYLKRCLGYILGGLAAGIFLGIGPGQRLAGLFLGSLGASGFSFLIRPERVFFLIPLVLVLAAASCAWISLREINQIMPYECCLRRE